MSGNNPHGHLSQPQNSSWNPLQLEQLNPLLPSFVRAPSPFDSMDLSLQSNRNSSSPLTKGLSASVPPEFGHKPPPPPPPPSHSQNNFPIHNLSTNSGVHHTQSMSAGPPPPLPKYMNTNGNDVDMQQQACGLYIRDTERINDDYAKMTNRSCENDIQSNLTKPVELVKECTYTNLSNKLIPSSPKKISPPPIQQQQHLQHQLQQQQLQHHQQHQQQQQHQQPHQHHQHQHQQLQQQTQHQHQQQQQQQQHHQLQQHQQQHQQQQQYSCSSNGPNSPENSRLTNLSNFTTPLNHLLTESTTSGSCLPPKSATDLTTANVTENSCNSLSTNDSPANVTSNEDSVDSSGSRTRRKRKPNKTVRMSHDSETDENISLGEQATHQGKHTPPSLPTIVDVSNSNGSLSLPPELGSSQQQQVQENISYGDHRVQKVSEVASVHQSSPPVVDKQPVTNDDRINIRSSSDSDENLHSAEIVNNNQTHRSDSDDVETIDKIAEMIAKSSNNSCAMISDEATSSCSNGSNKKSSSSPVVLNDDEDDIDKSPSLNAQQDTRTSDIVCVEPLSADSPSSKPNDLKSIFETSNPPSPNQTSHKSLPSPSPPPVVTTENAQNQSPNEKKSPSDNKSDNAKSTFEEVEYKLEEMFAGIEDEPQRESTAPTDDTAHSEVTTDLSLALALPTTKIKDDDEDSEHKPLSLMASTSNAVQKRLHPTPKNEQGPAKKKARLTKKPSNKKSKGKASISVAGTSKTSVAQGNKSKGGGTGGGGGGGGGGHNNSKTNNSTAKLEDPSLAAAAAETKYKGPYVLVKPDGTINVINAPIAEDESEKVSKVKKGPYTHVDRSKIRGIHMSTLGNKYDADTADATWMCVFCKKGPHKFGLGDLFGPYIITTKCEDYESTEKDDVDSEFVSRRKKCEMFQKTPYSLPIVPSAHSTATCTNSKKKKKTSESHAAIINDKSPEQRFFGMSKVSDTSYEVWMHEDCAVWAPGVFLIGARIVGLESSVWSSTNYTCSICTQKGAMICCLHRGCGEKAHIPCARLSTWDLNETDFKIYCEKHAVPVDTSS